MWWSVDVGPVHVVTISGEGEDDLPLVAPEQLVWLAADLAAFNAARNGRFLIVHIHRPLYCSSDGDFLSVSDCGEGAVYLRANFEDILFRNGVDLVLQAHKHSYERTGPVYNGTLLAPGAAPVYITVGNSGNREGLQCGRIKPLPAWSLQYLCAFGYATIAVNDTALTFTEWTVAGPGAPAVAADSVTIVH